MISPLDPRTLLSRPWSDTLTCGPLGQEKSRPLRMSSSLQALSLDRFCLVTLPDFLVRTNQLHTCFFLWRINDGLHYIFLAAESLIMDYITCWRMPKEDGRPAERTTRVEEDLRNSSFQGQTFAMFCSVINSSKTLPKVRQDVEALKDMPIPCCMCKPMVTAQSLGDEIHAVVKRPQWAGEHGQHTW